MMTYYFILGYVNKTRGLFSHYPAMLPENIHLLAHSCLHYVQTENGNILFHLGLPQKKTLKIPPCGPQTRLLLKLKSQAIDA